MKNCRRSIICLLAAMLLLPAYGYGAEAKRVILTQCGITESGELVMRGYVAGKDTADVGLVISKADGRTVYVWQTEAQCLKEGMANFLFSSFLESDNSIQIGDWVTASAAGCRPAKMKLTLLKRETKTFYLSPAGDDSNPGTETEPFATLEKARDAIRELKRQNGGILLYDVEVILQNGTYYRNQPFVLSDEDSGTETYRIVYRAQEKGKAVLSGAYQLIEGWQSEGNGIYSAPLPGFESVTVLFEEGSGGPKTAIPARFPNKKIQQPGAVVYSGENYLHTASGDKGGFVIGEQDSIPKIADAYALEAGVWQGGSDGFWRWFQEILPCTIDGKQVTFTQGQAGEVLGEGTAYYLQGAKEFLDAPGEFWYDRHGERIYYYPYEASDELQVRVPFTGNLVETTGGGAVSHIDFSGLGFTGGTRTKPWNPVGNLLLFHHAENMRVLDCRLYESAGGGVFVYEYCQNIAVENCDIHDLGSSGVALCSYARTAEERISGCRIVNNHIYNFGKLYAQHAGIMLSEASHNYAAHNLIHGGPRAGIYLFSNRPRVLIGEVIEGVLVDENNHEQFRHCHDNLIEFNEIYNCMWDSQDGGLIYSYGVHNNTYRNNILRDSTCAESYYMPLYFDDGSDRTTAENNLIYDHDWNNESGGIHCDVILRGSYNKYCNNIVAHNKNGKEYKGIYGVSSPRSHPDWADDPGELSQHQTIRHNIAYQTGTDSDTQNGKTVTYRILGDRYDDSILLFDTPDAADYNLFYNPALDDPENGENYIVRGDGAGIFNYKWYPWEKWQKKAGFDRHSQLADPKFVDSASNDYRFLPDSPAHALGIKEIWTDAIGLTADFPYADPYDLPKRLYIRGENQMINSYTIPAETNIHQNLILTVRSEKGYLLDSDKIEFTFTSEDPSIAEVSKDGVLMPYQEGEAVIAVTAAAGGKTISSSFRTAVEASSIRFQDQDGQQLLGQLASETQIITAYIDEEISGHLITCAYRQKRLVGFFATEVHQGSSVIFHIPEQADEVCFFLWDAEIKMLPLQNKITFLRST